MALLALDACGNQIGSLAGPDASTTAPATMAASIVDVHSNAPASTQPGATVGGFARKDAAFVAFHVGQGVTTTVDAHGALLAPMGARATWSMSLHANAIGRGGSMQPLDNSAPREGNGRIEIARAGGVTEWFSARGRGLEEGIDVAERPRGEGALRLEVASEGLTPALAVDGKRVELRDERGVAVLTYADLVVKDADGHAVPATMHVAQSAIVLDVRDESARYPIEIDPLVAGIQQAELVEIVGAASDNFGNSVAISGTTAIVGLRYKGAAYVFVQSGTTWTQQAKLVGDTTSTADFGSTVSVSGTTAILGDIYATVGATASTGAAYVFVQSGTKWTQQTTLVSSDGASGDAFGSSVAISGATAIVGADNKAVGANTAQGAAYVFTQSGTTWTQQPRLVATGGGTNDYFGYAVAVDGTTALVGASGFNGSPAGAAYIFSQIGSSWTQQAKLGSDKVGNGGFAQTLALHGTIAIVGAAGETGSLTDPGTGTPTTAGAAYVFAKSGPTWTKQARLTSDDGASGDNFGFGVAVSGSAAFVGARTNGHQGAAYVFIQSGSTWTQQAKLGATDYAPNDNFGIAIAADSTNAIVGAYSKMVGANAGQGVAYVFGPAHTNGDACSTVADCISGFCTEGVCCDSACGECLSCLASRKGAGADGTCGNVAAGGNDPVCTGSVCNSASVGAYACDGAGACAPPTSTTSCAPYACNAAGTACDTSCIKDADCTVGHCVGGACGSASDAGVEAAVDAASDAIGDAPSEVATTDSESEPAAEAAAEAAIEAATDTGAVADAGLAPVDASDAGSFVNPTKVDPLATSATCKADGDCSTGHCSEGLCCDSPCTDKCHSCALPGLIGTCTAEPAGVDLRNDCGALGNCFGTCAGNGTCGGATAGTICSPNHCSGPTTLTGAALCTGPGSACSTQGVVDFDCTPYTCEPAARACLQSCVRSDECANGYTCDTGSKQCVPSAPGGTPGGCAMGAARAGSAGSLFGLAMIGVLVACRRRSGRPAMS
ncbi:MAG: hypothetical protein ACHREM_20410 [Polyangiales bacterium]